MIKYGEESQYLNECKGKKVCTKNAQDTISSEKKGTRSDNSNACTCDKKCCSCNGKCKSCIKPEDISYWNNFGHFPDGVDNG